MYEFFDINYENTIFEWDDDFPEMYVVLQIIFDSVFRLVILF